MTYTRLDHSQARDSAHDSSIAPSGNLDVSASNHMLAQALVAHSEILTLVLVASLSRSTCSIPKALPKGRRELSYVPPITAHAARGMSAFSWYSEGPIWNVAGCFNCREPRLYGPPLNLWPLSLW